MLDLPHYQRFGEEAFGALPGLRAGIEENLDRPLLLPEQVLRAVYNTHAAMSNLTQDQVLLAKNGTRFQTRCRLPVRVRGKMPRFPCRSRGTWSRSSSVFSLAPASGYFSATYSAVISMSERQEPSSGKSTITRPKAHRLTSDPNGFVSWSAGWRSIGFAVATRCKLRLSLMGRLASTLPDLLPQRVERSAGAADATIKEARRLRKCLAFHCM